MHTITPKGNHAIITAHLALSSIMTGQCESSTDELISLLRAGIEKGLLADFSVYHTDNPITVTAPATPTPGCLFTPPVQAQTAMLEDFARYMVTFCQHRQQKNRPIDDEHINIDLVVNEFQRSRLAVEV